MARPSKGDRVAMTLRLPVDLAARINDRGPPDRHSFIIDAIAEKLEKPNAPEAQAEA